MKQCCTDHNGNQKKKYQSKEEAEKVAQRRIDEGVGIKVYPCEEGDGWHLTSQNAPPPSRPKNVMTREEQGLYTRQSKNRIGDLIGEEIGALLKDQAQKNTLQLLEEKINQLQRDVDERAEAVRIRRGELAILKNDLIAAEQELRVSKRNLSIATHEYNLARKRTTKNSS